MLVFPYIWHTHNTVKWPWGKSSNPWSKCVLIIIDSIQPVIENFKMKICYRIWFWNEKLERPSYAWTSAIFTEMTLRCERIYDMINDHSNLESVLSNCIIINFGAHPGIWIGCVRVRLCVVYPMKYSYSVVVLYSEHHISYLWIFVVNYPGFPRS